VHKNLIMMLVIIIKNQK